MKKVIFITIVVLIYSCKKNETQQPAQPTTGKVTFYMAPQSGTWDLLVDGVDKGLIDETTQAPVCGDVDFITLELSIGNHTADVKSLNGYAWGNPKTFTVAAGCTSFKVLYP